MTLAMERTRAITMRESRSDADWWAVRDLLVRTHQNTPVGWNWDVRHWDGSRFHSPTAEIARARQGPVALWEDGHRLVGAVHRDGPGWACIELDPDYRHIQAEMLDWAEEHLAAQVNGRRRLRLYVFDYDLTRRALLEELGYKMLDSGGWTRLVRFGEWVIADGEVAAPYRLATTSHKTARADAERMAVLLNAAFRRTQHSAAEYLPFMESSPSFSHDLNLLALAPDGSFAAHVGVNWDSINRFGIFEPVCTHPDHVRRGLAKALMLEGMRRLNELGALSATVETGDLAPANGLYRACGFTEEYRGHDFERDLPAA